MLSVTDTTEETSPASLQCKQKPCHTRGWGTRERNRSGKDHNEITTKLIKHRESPSTSTLSSVSTFTMTTSIYPDKTCCTQTENWKFTARVGRWTGKGTRRWYLFMKTILLCVYGQEGGCTVPSSPPHHPDSHKFCSGKEQGSGGHGPVTLSTYEAKADNDKFKAHLAPVSSRPT